MKLKTKTIEKNPDPKIWFFEKINKINKPLAKLSKKKRREETNYWSSHFGVVGQRLHLRFDS